MVEVVMAYGGCGWRLRKPNAPLCLLLNHTHPWLWWWRGDGVGVMVDRWIRGDEGVEMRGGVGYGDDGVDNDGVMVMMAMR
ncbi:hypothetical protein Tco_0464485 [Tanacetum coccineum]